MAPQASVSNQRSLKRSRDDFTDHITVLVGAQKKAFSIHKNIVCDKSDFFKAACKGAWKEGKEKTVRLPKADVRAFTIFVGWLYTHELDLSRDGAPPVYSAEMSDEAKTECYEDIYRCYHLGDFLSVRQFCNSLVNEFVTCSEGTWNIPPWGTVQDLIESGELRLSSTLGKVTVDYVAADLSEDDSERYMDNSPAAFVAEVAKVCRKEQHMDVEQRIPSNRPKCYYHEHKDEKDKCA